MIKKWFIVIFILFIFSGTLLWGQSSGSNEMFQEYERRIDLIKTNLDYVWVVLSAALVFFMQAGFMSLESGMARSKNSINVSIKNLTDFVLGVIGFWLLGFGFMFGKSWHGIIGLGDFLITVQDPWIAAFFIFQAVFVGTAATIDSGAICERAKLKQYIFLSFMLTIIIYPVFGHWAWGSFLHGNDPATGGAGWLEARGFKDFAGSSVVHSVGGWMALAGVIIVGPRLGKFTKDPVSGKIRANKIAPGDMRFVFLGTFILFFGWFGFNCGSTLAATSDIAVIALNTTLAACFGCLSSSTLSWAFHPEKKIEGEMIANGVLAGLVGITAGCAYVGTVGAVVIGLVAGVIVYAGSFFLERVLKLDDVVGAIPVHGFCGAWGTLAVGIFIRPDQLGDMTRLGQFQIQALGVAVCFLWAFGMGILFYFLTDKLLGGVRVTEEEEIMGLNIAEHGAKSSVLELAATMDNLTRSGDFSADCNVPVEYGTEIGDLAELFNRMIDRVRLALEESRSQRQIAQQMLRESEIQKQEVLKAQKDLEKERTDSALHRNEYIGQTKNKVGSVTSGIEGIKAFLGETSDKTRMMTENFETMTQSLNNMLDSLSVVYHKLGQVRSVTTSTSLSVNQSRHSISDLKQVTREVEIMVQHINDLADRTGILSINSSIEAARAGDRGKGFTVISKEVRDLSEETIKVATGINRKLADMESRVTNVDSSMENIISIMDEISQLNFNIISIIENNQNLSESLSADSSRTMGMVRTVTSDINNVVSKAENLASTGSQVQKELETIS